jgi:type II secretory pathway component PulK
MLTQARSTRRERRDGEGQEGIALIAVLWMLILLSIIAAALSLETRSNIRIARNMADHATARAAADAGIQRATLDLISIPDDQKFNTDGTVYNWGFGKGVVRISIQDELTKINLNEAPEATLAALFTSIGIGADRARSLADSIADFRDPDNLVRPQGAEAAQYRTAGLAWGPANAAFDSVEEVQQVLGIDGAIYRQIALKLTVCPSAEVFGVEARVYFIRSDAQDSDGASFVREAVVRLTGAEAEVLSWRQRATEHWVTIALRSPASIQTHVITDTWPVKQSSL